MNSEEKDINKTEAEVSNDEATKLNQNKTEGMDISEDDIIRNDTIPETKDTPGSNGAYPVGVFDTSKD